MHGSVKCGVCSVMMIVIICVLSVSFCPIVMDTDADAAVAPDTSPVKSIAHRGYSSEAPENTMPAFELAYEKGFRYVETDVSVTSDGKYVLLHDDTINRTSNGSGLISSMTLAKARTYDFGSWKSAEYSGTQIPELSDLLSYCSTHDIHPYIELKCSLSKTQIEEIIDIIDSYSMLDRCSIIAMDYGYLEKVRDYADSVRLGYVQSFYASSLVSKILDLSTASNSVFLDVEHISESGCRTCEGADIPVEIWTVDDADTMRSMDTYISGVTSNSLRYCDVCAVVTLDLVNCASNNNSLRADIGSTYDAYIEPTDGDILDTITCTMGGVPQPVNGGSIRILNVTGDITITANAGKSVTYGSSDFMNGYVDITEPDQTVDRVYSGDNYYYALTTGNGTLYPAFDIVLSPNATYTLTINTSKTLGTEYAYSLHFFNSYTYSQTVVAYMNDQQSISGFTACCYDTLLCNTSNSMTIVTGSADVSGDFDVTISPGVSGVQQYKVCGFRILLTNADGTAAVDPSDFTVTLTKTKCPVMFYPNNDTSIQTQSIDVGGLAVKPTDPVKNGYTFGGWYGDIECTKSFDFSTPINYDTELYAKWVPAEYRIIYVTNGGDPLADGKYTSEKGAELPTPKRNGYNFEGWYDNEQLSGERVYSIPAGSTGDVTVYAKWSSSGIDVGIIIGGVVAAIIAIAVIAFFVMKKRIE